MEEEKERFAKSGGSGKRAFLVGAGEGVLDPDSMVHLAQNADLTLSVDGGFDHLYPLGIRPDLLLGDFDSSKTLRSKPDLLQSYRANNQLLVFPSKKDDPDSVLGFFYLAKAGFNQVDITGLVGSRLDHSFSNILFLKCLSEKGVKGRILSQNNRVWYLPPGTYRLAKPDPAWYISFFNFQPGVKITLEGFEYQVDNWSIPTYYSKATSNHIVQEDNRIEVLGPRNGGVFLFQSRDQSPGGQERPDQDILEDPLTKLS